MFTLALLGGLLALPGAVSADPNISGSVNQLVKTNRGSLSLEHAIQQVRSAYNAKVLSASEIQSKGPLVYQIKILLPNGRVRTVFVDGHSGEVFE